MKRLSLLLPFLWVALAPIAAQAENAPRLPKAPQDTIIIKMPNQAQMTLILKNNADISTLREYNLDSLMVMLGKYAKQVEQAAKSSDAKQVTLDFYPSRDSLQPNAPEKVTITLSETSRAAGSGTGNGRRSESHNVEVQLAKALKIDVKYDERTDKTTVRVNRNADSTAVHHQEKAQRQEEKRIARSTKFKLDIDLGLNTLLNTEPILNQGEVVNYDLRPLGSRYISINTHIEPRIGGPTSPLHLRSGLELAFNNYMFDKNVSLTENDGQTIFYNETERVFQKSKLATSSINVPLMVMLKFRNSRGKNAFSIGAGGFVGHRLGSHTKVKYPEGGRNNKDKERSNFNLNDVQYGTNLLVGVGSLQLFAKYNANPLFRDNRGPEANALSFGLTIFH